MQSFDTGGFASDSRLADLVKEGILHMCSQLKPEAVAVADSLAPPDFVLKSVIGKSDGKVCTVKTYPLPDYGYHRSVCSEQNLLLVLIFVSL